MNELNTLSTTTAREILNESRTYNDADRLSILAEIMLPRFMDLTYPERASADKDQFAYVILPMTLQGFISAQEVSLHVDERFRNLLAPLAYVSSPHVRNRMQKLLAEQHINLPSLDTSRNELEHDWYWC